MKITTCMIGLSLCVLSESSRAQEQLPVLRANSTVVDVRQGERLYKGDWTVDPSIPLDTYPVRRSATPITITFITDVESRSFEVAPGGTVDFVILLNGKDACRTRLAMTAMSAKRAEGSNPVTIPITFVKGKPHLRGRLNGSEPLDLIFDTGANTTVLYPSGKTKGVTIVLDGSAMNAGTGGTTLRQTSSDNRLEVGGLAWDHESVLFVENQADQADGILGYNVFEDKVVELDYDRMVMVIHDDLPEHAAAYTRVPMPFIGELTAVGGVLRDGSVRASGPMIIDTGGTGALVVNRTLITQNGLHAGLKKVGSSESTGVGPTKTRIEVLRVPTLEIAGYAMKDVPVGVPVAAEQHQVSGVATEDARGLLCMDVLSRFNTLFDYRKSEAYFKPNSRFADAFPVRASRMPAAVTWAIAAAMAFGAAVTVVRLRSNASRGAGAVPG